MSSSGEVPSIDGLKQTAEQTLTTREEYGRGDESHNQREEFQSKLETYLVEDIGVQEEVAKRQASNIAVDTLIGDLEEAKKKIEAIDKLDSLVSEDSPAEPVKQAALNFHSVQKRHERGSEIYLDAKEDLREVAENYFESEFDLDGCSYEQANRLTTEVALGDAHIYDAIEKLDAIETLRTVYAEVN